MTTVRIACVRCDGSSDNGTRCPEERTDYMGVMELRLRLKEYEGWTRNGGRDYCQDHSPEATS